jgi:hypothetical protein
MPEILGGHIPDLIFREIVGRLAGQCYVGGVQRFIFFCENIELNLIHGARL